MIIKALAENTAISDEYGSEHGLSLYLETKKHKLLFDTGASGLFIKNAEKMNIDLSAVDLVVISHGHYDHVGGLKYFLKINKKARIYIRPAAINRHFACHPEGVMVNIGLEECLKHEDRLYFTGESEIIDEELQLFSNVATIRLNPSSNTGLLMEEDANLVPDTFSHEQNLIVREAGKVLLMAGCAHNGIVNIMEHMIARYEKPDYVIGGYHMYSKTANACEDPEVVSLVGAYLKCVGAKYYTCHCTGLGPYCHLRTIIGDGMQYISTGSSLRI